MTISFDQQKKKFLQVKSKNSLQSGTVAYLISATWFNKWKSLVGIDIPPNPTHSPNHKNITLPPIDNNVLLLKGRLKPALTEKFDFIVLSEPLWKLFLKWYPDSGPEISVELIDHPVEHKPVPILFELTFNVYLEEKGISEDQMKFVEVHMNKYQTIRDIKEKACEILELDPDRTQLCDYWNRQLHIPLRDETKYLYNLHLVDTQELLLQIMNPDGSFNRPRRTLNRTISRTNSSMAIDPHVFRNVVIKKTGRIGLTNLGNTCFFNSAVQALSHTPMFYNFFLSQDWRADINCVNRLSTNGRIANAMAQLVNDIWTKDAPYLIPQRLYDIIAEYAPRFGDHQQHDAQELMLFLLDGIHEDLNRANKHVYTEGFEGDLAREETVAEAAWRRHKLTNDSAIVDLFHGQLRSELSCPHCKQNKVVFDPYLCVTLPMPIERLSSVKYFFVPYDMKKQRCLVKFFVGSNEIDSIHDDAMKQFNLNSNPEEAHSDCIVVARDDLLLDYGLRLLPSLRKLDYFVFEVPDSTKLYSFASVNCEYQNKKNTNTLIAGPLLVEVPDSILAHQNEIAELFNSKKKPKKSVKKKTVIKETLINSRSSMTTRSSEKKKLEQQKQSKVVKEVDQEIEAEGDNEEFNEKIIAKADEIFKLIADEIMETCYERFDVYWQDTEYKMDDRYRLLDKQIATEISPCLLDWMNGDVDQRFFAQPVLSTNLDVHSKLQKLITHIADSSDNPLYIFLPSDEHPNLTTLSLKIILNPLLSKESEGFSWPAVHPVNLDVNTPKEKEKVTLTKCLEYFSYPDNLDELNEWFCPKCRKLVPAAAKLDIWSVPDNLILHIKRFVFKDGSYHKISNSIEIPEILDMKPYVTGPQKDCESLKYVLHSTINHIGIMGGGHYTSCSYSDDQRKWFTYNDDNVYPTASSITNSETAYVLFYHRVAENIPLNPFTGLRQLSDPRKDSMEQNTSIKKDENEESKLD